MKISIVTTTINVPTFFDGYCQDIILQSDNQVSFVVIGDKKTPIEVGPYCEGLEKKYNLPIEYYDVDRQISYLKKFPELEAYLPYNSVQRRNIGMIRAYEQGNDVIITVDDDNYIREPNILKGHNCVGKVVETDSVSSSVGWFDPCTFLTEKHNIPFCHRGFPRSRRGDFGETTWDTLKGRVVVNVGLWLGDPDVDAWTRMTHTLDVVAWNRSENFVLKKGTWAPFNSQQTALARELLPAYFLNPNAGRYDDIWASYIIHRIANHKGDYISYGYPIVLHEQKRSLGSLWRDIDDERVASLLNEEFLQVLQETALHANSYRECYEEIAGALRLWVASGKIKVPKGQEFMEEYVRGIEMWQRTINRIG
jgi:hypothetical protein